MDALQIPLYMAQEYAAWARHYDMIRIGITSLLVTLAIAIVPAAFWLIPRRLICTALLSAFLGAGLFLTGLSASYSKLYTERSWAAFKIRHYVLKQQNLSKPVRKVTVVKIDKKVAQAYFEAFCAVEFGEPACETTSPFKISEATRWRQDTVLHILSTGWFWLNFFTGIFVPLALLLGIQRGWFHESCQAEG